MLDLNRIRAAVGRFHNDRRGGVFVLISLSFLVLIGAAALAVDMGNAYSLESRLQSAADASALAAARELPDAAQVNARAQEYAIKNMGTRYGQVVDNDDVAIGNWDASSRTFTASANPTNAVQVTAKLAQENGNPAPTFFGRVFGMDSIDISANAVATGGASRCVYVLDNTQKSALKVSGTAQIEMDCGVAVLSANNNAFTTDGSGCLNATSIEVVGGSSSDNCGQPPTTGVASSISDPLSDLPPPDWWECDFEGTMNLSETATLTPGTYCSGVTINSGANVTMEPGEYVFWGVPVSINGGATVTGDGVTIYFTEGGGANGTFSVAGGASVTLTAPLDGPRAAVVFYSDRNATQNVTHHFTGGAAMDLTGIIYTPNQGLAFAGGAELTGSCVTIIARELDFVGDTEITALNDCPDELSTVMSDLRLVQ